MLKNIELKRVFAIPLIAALPTLPLAAQSSDAGATVSEFFCEFSGFGSLTTGYCELYYDDWGNWSSIEIPARDASILFSGAVGLDQVLELRGILFYHVGHDRDCYAAIDTEADFCIRGLSDYWDG